MLKNDLWIAEQASLGMLEPFQEKLIRHLEPESEKSPVLSFGWDMICVSLLKSF